MKQLIKVSLVDINERDKFLNQNYKSRNYSLTKLFICCFLFVDIKLQINLLINMGVIQLICYILLAL